MNSTGMSYQAPTLYNLLWRPISPLASFFHTPEGPRSRGIPERLEHNGSSSSTPNMHHPVPRNPTNIEWSDPLCLLGASTLWLSYPEAEVTGRLFDEAGHHCVVHPTSAQTEKIDMGTRLRSGQCGGGVGRSGRSKAVGFLYNGPFLGIQRTVFKNVWLVGLSNLKNILLRQVLEMNGCMKHEQAKPVDSARPA